MIAVIFEVWPHPDHKQEYLDIAGDLRPLLMEIDGFISVERFESIYEPGKMLSLSFWRDEKAVEAWRNVAEHRVAQAQGRGFAQNTNSTIPLPEKRVLHKTIAMDGLWAWCQTW